MRFPPSIAVLKRLILLAIAYMIGIELISSVIEEPFSVRDHDMPLDHYCEAIDRFLLQLTEALPPTTQTA